MSKLRVVFFLFINRSVIDTFYNFTKHCTLKCLINTSQNLLNIVSLDLEGSRLSAATGTLELATLGLDSWSLMLVGTEAEVSDGLSRLSGTSEDDSVLTLWSTTSKLVQSDSLTTGLENTGLSRLGESQSSDGSLWNLSDTVVVSDSANNNNGLVGSTLVLDSSSDTGDRDRRTVDFGQEQGSENHFVEASVGTTSEESVELDQELQVDVV